MQKRAPHLTDSENVIATSELVRSVRDYLTDAQIRNLSPRTIEERRNYLNKLLWFLRTHDYEVCGPSQLREFLAYLGCAHEKPQGRWNEGTPKSRRALRPITIRSYHTQLRVLFNWLADEGVVSSSPMARIKAPRALTERVHPFTTEQVEAFMVAAHRSKHATRDEAIIVLLFDTGIRASELCGLRKSDLDMGTRSCTVIGKGNKKRIVPFGLRAQKTLWNHLRGDRRENDEPLFVSDRGTRANEAITRSGLLQLVERLGKRAGVQREKCSPRTFRHTFAVDYLRNGGDVFSLQLILGHTSLQMTNRYVALAQADIERKHRQFSPADRLRRQK